VSSTLIKRVNILPRIANYTGNPLSFGCRNLRTILLQKTLEETEALVALMLFATGLQNGLTASISNFSVKTTHLTGTTTDLGYWHLCLLRKNSEKP
jgi:hypothetical protein